MGFFSMLKHHSNRENKDRTKGNITMAGNSGNDLKSALTAIEEIFTC